MEINLFDKFIEEARELRPEYIHLQGWGEPLLHPNFDKFVKKSLEVSKRGSPPTQRSSTPSLMLWPTSTLW
jgi:MoaA/NifB/PqqE/SkfB family radical SAM enzyme